MKETMSEIGMSLISCGLLLIVILQAHASSAEYVPSPVNIILMNGTVTNETAMTASPPQTTGRPSPLKRSIKFSATRNLFREIPVRHRRSKDPNAQSQTGSTPGQQPGSQPDANTTTYTSTPGTKPKRSAGEDDYDDDETVRHKRRPADMDYYDDYQEPATTVAPPPEEPSTEPVPPPTPEPVTPPPKPTPKPKGKRSVGGDSYEKVQSRHKRSPDDEDDYGDDMGDMPPPDPPMGVPASPPPADPEDDYMDISRKRRGVD